MRHANVLSIEGVAPKLFELCMVSKWMDRGNMLLYLRENGKVDRARLVSLPVSVIHQSALTTNAQLRGITRGLVYLHSNGVIHGDLKGVSKAFDLPRGDR
jgi:serine/threonine protein kinase